MTRASQAPRLRNNAKRLRYTERPKKVQAPQGAFIVMRMSVRDRADDLEYEVWIRNGRLLGRFYASGDAEHYGRLVARRCGGTFRKFT